MSYPGFIPILTGINSPIMEEGCPFCFQYFYLADIKIHLTQCNSNPANLSNPSTTSCFSEITNNSPQLNKPTVVHSQFTFSLDEYDEYNEEEFAIQDSFILEDTVSDIAAPLLLNFCAFDEYLDTEIPPSPPLNRFCAVLDYFESQKQATPSLEHVSNSNNKEIINVNSTQSTDKEQGCTNSDAQTITPLSLTVSIPTQSLVLSSHTSQLIQETTKDISPSNIQPHPPDLPIHTTSDSDKYEYISSSSLDASDSINVTPSKISPNISATKIVQSLDRSNLPESYISCNISEKSSEMKSRTKSDVKLATIPPISSISKVCDIPPVKPDIQSGNSVQSNLRSISPNTLEIQSQINSARILSTRYSDYSSIFSSSSYDSSDSSCGSSSRRSSYKCDSRGSRSNSKLDSKSNSKLDSNSNSKLDSKSDIECNNKPSSKLKCKSDIESDSRPHSMFPKRSYSRSHIRSYNRSRSRSYNRSHSRSPNKSSSKSYSKSHSRPHDIFRSRSHSRSRSRSHSKPYRRSRSRSPYRSRSKSYRRSRSRSPYRSRSKSYRRSRSRSPYRSRSKSYRRSRSRSPYRSRSKSYRRSRSRSYDRSHNRYLSYSRSRSDSRSYDSFVSSPDRPSSSKRQSSVKSKEVVYQSELYYSYKESDKSVRESSYCKLKRKILPSPERSTPSKHSKYDSVRLYNRIKKDLNNATATSSHIPNFYPHSDKLNTESIYRAFSQTILPSFPSICNKLWLDKQKCYLNQPTSTSTPALPRFDNTNSTLQLPRQKVPNNTEPHISKSPQMYNLHHSSLPKITPKSTNNDPKISSEKNNNIFNTKNAPNYSNPKQLEDTIEKCTTVTNENTIQPSYPYEYAKNLFIFGDDTSYLGFPVISREHNIELVCMLCKHHSTTTCYSRHLMNHIKVICIFCEKEMNTYVLLPHLFIEHSFPEAELTKCPICNNKRKKIISSYSRLFRHILTFHYRLDCPVCPSSVGLFTFESHVDKCVTKLVKRK